MIKISIKDYVIIGLVLILGYLAYINYNKKDILFDDSIYKQKEQSLKNKLDSLNKILLSETNDKNKFQNKIDSLEEIKQKIKYVYINKEKEIDTASVSNLIHQFDGIFSESSGKSKR